MGERVWLDLNIKTNQIDKLPDELQLEEADNTTPEWSRFSLSDVSLRVIALLHTTQATFFGSCGGGVDFGMYAFFCDGSAYHEREIGYNGGYCTSVLSDVDIESAKKFALTYERMEKEACGPY